MVRVTMFFVATLLTCSFSVTATAHQQFKRVFEKHYAELYEDDAIKKTFRRAKCNLCHQKGEKKEMNNPYGDALAGFIEDNAEDRLQRAKENNRKQEEMELILAELRVAIEEVESVVSPYGTTFGERIRNGRLPVEIPASVTKEDASNDQVAAGESAE